MVRKVLFVSYGGGHVNMLMPIYKRMLETLGGSYKPYYFALTTAQVTLEKHRLPFFGYKEILDKNNDKDALIYGEELLSEMGDSGIISKDESISYLGLSFKDIVLNHGLEKAKTLYKEKGRHAFLQRTIAKRVIDKIKPDIIIVTNSPKTEKAFALEAYEKKIPCVVLVDMFNENEMKDRLGKKNYGDRICVLNEFTKKTLLKMERKENEVYVTGNPAFDQLFFEGADCQAIEYAKRLNLRNEGNILWARQCYPFLQKYNQEIDEALIKFSREQEGIHLIFRPHPNDARDFNFDDDPHVSLSLGPSSEIPLLLRNVDICVTINSTLGLEAHLLGRPVITIEDERATTHLSFEKSNVSKGVKSIDDLLKELTVWFNKRKTMKRGLPQEKKKRQNAVDGVLQVIGSL